MDYKKELLENLKNINILLVEDSLEARDELEIFFRNKVKKLYLASDGQEGYDLYKKYKPDLVLSDIKMPKLDGLEMAKLIREFDKNSKIILITAFNDTDYMYKAIQLHVDNYVIKPIDYNLLLESVLEISKIINLDKINKSIQNTLEQYKDIVDERSIVSKTDINGLITYVNKPFENISGYKKEELIGRPHSIIRHKETPKYVFEDLWKTIINKKTWYGTIKNKKKNGSSYIVDTIIKPILNINGEIEEFIALRNDITDLEESKEYFKNQSEKTNLDLKESIRIAKIYEDAVDKCNIILRVSTDKKIIFVNDAFCKISGYSKHELIGQPYSILRDKNIDIEEYEQSVKKLKNELDEGKVYDGNISNTAKDGSIYHCKYTVFPIKDKDDKIVEYMSIRHDITQIIKLHSELEETQREVIYKLGEIGETRSKETGNHVKRVAEYSKILATKLGLEQEDIDILFAASPMHDIGKVGIPDSILNKPGKLTPDEWVFMQTHSEIGYNILKSSTRPILKAAAIISYTHHEKWNGKGYPRGLKGDEIHIFGRITAIADVFDALGSDRCYKKAWELDRILKLLEEQRGKHFDSQLIDLFMENLDDFLEIRDRYKDDF
ncbi:HD domain-containing phosphohydrolase [Halarcobacter sp.]|uniref:HD domain-containing phosphohydrolase n=1 Tax=Halarcobacter sp. TaxID=2321133 RepID=UPI002AAAB24B|nr:HD domain-containing phosphohydrolase [Halarcobacter sp.]